jgi:hypothetical protein
LLALTLPVRLWPLTRFPRLLPAALYGVPLALNLAYQYLALTGREAGLARTLVGLSYPVVLLSFLAAVFGGLVHNFRTVRDPTARAQLRWIAFGMGVGWGVPIGLAGILLAFNRLDPLAWANTALWLTLLLPLALAVAILRYRLFDVDVLIRRTLIYSTLTAALAAAYFASVLVLQGVFQLVTGEARSQVVTVLSTLTIAALFRPLRSRIQAGIDRRFYRRKYDAARTLAAFGAQARDVVDLPTLNRQLLNVVNETMRPAHTSLWLRPDRGATLMRQREPHGGAPAPEPGLQPASADAGRTSP